MTRSLSRRVKAMLSGYHDRDSHGKILTMPALDMGCLSLPGGSTCLCAVPY
ncbi:MAG: hypothetical protein OXU40_10035 [Nitrospira sp.]|nr:hypothetical protein [Nitrospira sp.]